MRLELLAKDSLSGEKNCPSVHDDLDGTDFVLVGPTVDSAHLENVLPGEIVIRMNREIVIEAVRRYLAR
jgi:malic enzyme